MTENQSWLTVAKDECETLRTYSELLENVADKDALKEIMGDEFNHALIALCNAAKSLDVVIASDGIDEAMEGVKFTGEIDDED